MEKLGALDAGVAGGAEGHQARQLRNPGLAVVDDEQLTGATTAALTVVAGQDLSPQAGEVPPVPALTLIAAPALPCRIQFLRAAGAEQRPLAELRTELPWS